MFRIFFVKSTIFEIELSFKYIFGVAENFWFIGGVKKGGSGRPPPGSAPDYLDFRDPEMDFESNLFFPPQKWSDT